MTSGEFHSIEIDSIVVKRSERQRRELRGLDELSFSIKRSGLINPILVQRDTHELVAGERRLSACRLLGWTHVPAQYTDELEPRELKLIELEENTRRSDLTWQEQCLALDELHGLYKAEDPDWSAEKTAESIGSSHSDVLNKLQVAREIRTGNAIIAEAPKLTTAYGIIRRANERKADAEIARALAVEQATPQTQERRVLNVDFHEWASVYSGPRFNFIHCDFPYGINADDRHQGYNHEEHGAYEDTPESYWLLLGTLSRFLDRFCLESAHLMFWFSMRHYHETLTFLNSRTPFTVDPFPLIWVKSDNIGLLPDPERGPRRIYETCLFGSRGDRKVVRAVSNAFSAPSVRTEHMSEKSQLMLENFFRMFVDSSTLMLDPTCGSGSALRAAKAAGAATVLGLEKDPAFAERANERML